MKRNHRAEKKRWTNWRNGFFARPLKTILADYDGPKQEPRNEAR